MGGVGAAGSSGSAPGLHWSLWTKESDVYALAILGYTIFSRRMPYSDVIREAEIALENFDEVDLALKDMNVLQLVGSSDVFLNRCAIVNCIVQIHDEDDVRPSPIPPECPGIIQDIIRECWAKNPARRPGVS